MTVSAGRYRESIELIDSFAFAVHAESIRESELDARRMIVAFDREWDKEQRSRRRQKLLPVDTSVPAIPGKRYSDAPIVVHNLTAKTWASTAAVALGEMFGFVGH